MHTTGHGHRGRLGGLWGGSGIQVIRAEQYIGFEHCTRDPKPRRRAVHLQQDFLARWRSPRQRPPSLTHLFFAGGSPNLLLETVQPGHVAALGLVARKRHFGPQDTHPTSNLQLCRSQVSAKNLYDVTIRLDGTLSLHMSCGNETNDDHDETPREKIQPNSSMFPPAVSYCVSILGTMKWLPGREGWPTKPGTECGKELQIRQCVQDAFYVASSSNITLTSSGTGRLDGSGSSWW